MDALRKELQLGRACGFKLTRPNIRSLYSVLRGNAASLQPHGAENCKVRPETPFCSADCGLRIIAGNNL